MNTNIFSETIATTPKEISTFVGWSFGISDRIDARIKEMGLTQKEFAQKMGKTEAEVSRWLSGTHNFTIKTLAKISALIEEDLIKV